MEGHEKGFRSDYGDDQIEENVPTILVHSTVSDDLSKLFVVKEKSPLFTAKCNESTEDDVLVLDCSTDEYTFIDQNGIEDVPKVCSQNNNKIQRKRHFDETTEARKPPRKLKRSKKIERHPTDPLGSATHLNVPYVDENNNYLTQSMPIIEINNNNIISEPLTLKKFWILDFPCVKSLINDCKSTNCKFTHKLPDVHIVSERLNTIDVDEVRKILRLEIKLFNRLIEKYFCTFCEYFSRNKLKSDLINMIMICNNPKRQMQSYFVHILDGLVNMEIDYAAALIMILNFNKQISKKSMFVFSKLITDKRNSKPQVFLKNLQTFHDEHQFKFNTIFIERFMHISLEAQNCVSWIRFAQSIVNKCTEDELNLLDKELLGRFCKINPLRPNYLL